MPVIVVGADTAPGREIAAGLWSPDREVRLFVSDPVAGASFKERGFKVATGDVSDGSHVEAAATHCFTAVLVAEAATDGRERSFAHSATEVMTGWAAATEAAGVSRVVWVTSSDPPSTVALHVATVDPARPGYVERVVDLDDSGLRL